MEMCTGDWQRWRRGGWSKTKAKKHLTICYSIEKNSKQFLIWLKLVHATHASAPQTNKNQKPSAHNFIMAYFFIGSIIVIIMSRTGECSLLLASHKATQMRFHRIQNALRWPHIVRSINLSRNSEWTAKISVCVALSSVSPLYTDADPNIFSSAEANYLILHGVQGNIL